MTDWKKSSQSIARTIAAGDIEKALKMLSQAEKDFGHKAGFHLLKGDALWSCGEIREGCYAYERALEIAPDSVDTLCAAALARYDFLEFAEARDMATRALELADPNDPTRADLYDILSCLAERDGDFDESDRLTTLATEIDPEAFPSPCRMKEAEFHAVAAEAVHALPAEFLKALQDNLAIVIESIPPKDILEMDDPPLSPSLLGLYTGVPLPERDSSTSPPHLPDVIHLFQRNIERESSSRDEVADQIAITVYHEIGHYFGMGEEELEELDLG
ncbi:MAG: metallopeptidase family protein [Candidatus Eisenbacteria sp.]|nr:metallopeptidase family protein [Candidatus Eisenbacteria bacterium]